MENQKIKAFYTTPRVREVNFDIYGLDTMNKFLDVWHLDLNPDFQRGSVWTPEQQTLLIEHLLQGGFIPPIVVAQKDHIFYKKDQEPMVIVDGKQRWEAIYGFLTNKIKAFGYYFNELTHKDLCNASIFIHTVDVGDYKNVIDLFIRLNTAGTVVDPKVIQRAKEMLKDEGTL